MCVGEWHIYESVDGHYYSHHVTPLVEYLTASMKVAPENLEKRMDNAEFVLDTPIDACWAHFQRVLKMKTVPFEAKMLLVDNFCPHDAAV
eukprot:CAMPEP_0202956022 /NCGR_PEP_ID=MMETSP1396-20130829/556_1 /ASSEMBLY_ACC=CAM_ASM_000872 /TAXON_ID= /ORGANISM="Pseudokeronopsis sp., Strain Brazil" /LENGTH=89 /DNA_ID=CAMNT_0049672849 /DNA_START=1302 /DNA_END=1571 /DNA_ORIENTATION=-